MSKASVKQIPKDVVKRLCNEQIILTLSGACKELIENAVDAGSKDIEIRVKNQGADFLEVVDQGSGIHSTDFESLGKPHWTSKLRTFDDLEAVETYGFRGEALSALCSVSKLTICTRHQDEAMATKLEFDEKGNITGTSKCCRLIGTTVTLENLFCTLPVRQKELQKNLSREWRRLLTTIQSYAIVCEGVRFCLKKWPQIEGQKNVILMTEGKSLEENCSQLFAGVRRCLVPIHETAPSAELCADFGVPEGDVQKLNIKLRGLVSRGEQGTGVSTTDKQFTFIRSRPCDYPQVRKIVNDCFHEYNRVQSPLLFLKIEMEKGLVDVNVTPDKRRLLVVHQAELFAVVKASFQALFSTTAGVSLSTDKSSLCSQIRPSTSQKKDKTNNRPDTAAEGTVKDSGEHVGPPEPKKQKSLEEWSFGRTEPTAKRKAPVQQKQTVDLDRTAAAPSPTFKVPLPPAPKNPITEREIRKEEKQKPREVDREGETWRQEFQLPFSFVTLMARRDFLKAQKVSHSAEETELGSFEARLNPSAKEEAEKELSRNLKKEDFKRMRVIGQFNLGFIVASLDNNLFIIDQHASDEKYTFETLQKQAVVQIQKLITPKSLKYSMISESVIKDNLEIFKKNGFEFEFSLKEAPGHQTKLTGIPEIGGLIFDESDIDELIAVLTDFPGMMYRPFRFKSVFASRACRKSVMIGTALSPLEMIRILEHLTLLDNPWNCPHGRPTIRHLLDLKLLENS